MKKTNICFLCIALFFLAIYPAKASQLDTILVYSNELSLVVLITPQADKQAEVITIPSKTVFPIQCANQTPATLSSISEESMSSCIMDSLSTSLSLSITHYIYLDGNSIDTDYPSTLTMQRIHSFEQLQTYFSKLSEQLELSIVWKFPQYMKTDLSLWELYDFYTLYISEDFMMRYKFLHLLQVGNRWYALDKKQYSVP